MPGPAREAGRASYPQKRSREVSIATRSQKMTQPRTPKNRSRNGPPSRPRAADGAFRRRGLHDQVVDEVGLRIVRDEFGVEGLLPTEPALGAELGVSRNALREAIKVLVSKGLVEVRPKTGARVR